MSIRPQTEKTTFSCKDDCTMTRHIRCWTNSTRDFEILLCRTPPLRSFFFILNPSLMQNKNVFIKIYHPQKYIKFPNLRFRKMPSWFLVLCIYLPIGNIFWKSSFYILLVLKCSSLFNVHFYFITSWKLESKWISYFANIYPEIGMWWAKVLYFKKILFWGQPLLLTWITKWLHNQN